MSRVARKILSVVTGLVTVAALSVVAAPASSADAGGQTAGELTTEALPPPPSQIATGSGPVEASAGGTSCLPDGTCFMAGQYTSPDSSGPLLWTRNGADWVPSVLPQLADALPGSIAVGDVDCTTASVCVIKGGYSTAGVDLDKTMFWTFENGQWTVTAAPLPADAATESEARVYDLACGGTTCIAQGDYTLAGGSIGLAVWSLYAGTWTVVKAPLPTDAIANQEAGASDLACTASGTCAMIGGYANDAGGTSSAIWTFASGTWSVIRAPRPSGAPATDTDFDVVSPTQVSCSAVACFAIGDYLDSVSNVDLPAVWTMAGTDWTVAQLPLPTDAVSEVGSGPFLSCDTSGTCAAAERYLTNSGAGRAALWALIGGHWQLTDPPNPTDAADNPDPNLQFEVLSCGGSGVCVAGAMYSPTSGGGATELALWSLSDSTWTGGTALEPDDVGKSINAMGASCGSDGICAINGTYNDINGIDQNNLIWVWNGKAWAMYSLTSPVVAGSAVQVDLPLCIGEGTCIGTSTYGLNGVIEEATWTLSMAGTAVVSSTIPGSIVLGADPVGFTGTLDNSAGPALSNVRYDFSVTGASGLSANQVHIDYRSMGTSGGWLSLPLTGSTASGGQITGQFGPPEGFNVPAGATDVTDFEITVDSGAPSGTVTTRISLDQLTNQAGVWSVSSTLTSTTAATDLVTVPLVTTQPQNASVTAGRAASFTAAASGTPVPTVQWQSKAPGASGFSDIDGATSTTFAVPTTALDDSGTLYRAVFINSEGTTTSNAATLTVTAANTGTGSSGGNTGGDTGQSNPPATPPATPVTTTVKAGGTASSASSAQPTAADPVVASVQSPVAGTVTFTPMTSAAPQTGYTVLGHSFVITAPAATPQKPLQLSFAVDTGSLPSGASLADLTVFRDGVAVPVCVGTSGIADPDPCVTSVTTASGDAEVKVLSSHASTWTFGIKGATDGNRIAGSNRYETSAKIATEFGTATAVVLANGTDAKGGADALAANYLAGRVGAPILLTQATTVDPAILAAVKSVLKGANGPTVYVMGGSDAVSAAVVSEVQTAAKTAASGTVKVVRVAGVDRYSTSAMAAAKPGAVANTIGFSSSATAQKTAILASGVVNADALAAGAFSDAWGIPVLLIGSSDLPASVAAAIKDLKITQLIVLGGTDRVSVAALDQAEAVGVTSIKRTAGSDRFATAAALYGFAFDSAVNADGDHYGASSDGGSAYVANGVTGFPDALSVGPLAGKSEAALLTTGPSTLASPAGKFLSGHASILTTVIGLGQAPTLAASVLAAAGKAIA